jgi:hypothetical protein
MVSSRRTRQAISTGFMPVCQPCTRRYTSTFAFVSITHGCSRSLCWPGWTLFSALIGVLVIVMTTIFGIASGHHSDFGGLFECLATLFATFWDIIFLGCAWSGTKFMVSRNQSLTKTSQVNNPCFDMRSLSLGMAHCLCIVVALYLLGFLPVTILPPSSLTKNSPTRISYK